MTKRSVNKAICRQHLKKEQERRRKIRERDEQMEKYGVIVKELERKSILYEPKKRITQLISRIFR